jgi:hypothetical protein
MAEEWRDVVGFEGRYKVSNLGRIQNAKGVMMKFQVNRGGYERLTLRHDDHKDYDFTVHRVVAYAFIPNIENKPQINHIDGNRRNNNVDNLEWCTQSENILHAFKLGNKDQSGIHNNMAKITEKIVRDIRKRSKTELQKNLAKEYSLSKANICMIVNRKTWAHVK